MKPQPIPVELYAVLCEGEVKHVGRRDEAQEYAGSYGGITGKECTLAPVVCYLADSA